MHTELAMFAMVAAAAAGAIWLMRRSGRVGRPHTARRIEPAFLRSHANRKPEWAVRHLVLLKAHLPHAGCRLIAVTFNRVFAHRGVSVSKSFVHRVLREQALAVAQARKAIRQAVPRPVALNHCWGLDLTGRTDSAGDIHTILGIVDHGSRLAVRMARVPNKCGWTLLGHLCLAIASLGRPRFVRTDNEASFCGRVFSAGLRLLGIRHQRTDLHCPWQNGKIERLFGSLKWVLRRLSLADGAALDALLLDWQRWYNALRPYQNLGGLTPQEAWDGVDPFHAPQAPKDVRFVEGWDGLIAGFRIRR